MKRPGLMQLFLFDIDGTLVRRLPPAHRNALCVACQEVYGVTITAADLGGTAGMTDRAILGRVLLAAGVAGAAITAGLPEFLTRAADAYDRLVDADLRAYRTPHSEEALGELAERGDALGLVTGNIERIAWRKLGAAGLAGYFRCGAFGNEADSRDDLPPLALARAERVFGRVFAPDQVFVVGDTPADIGCGAASGLRTIGVATGPEHTREHLLACHPDYLLDDLRGLAALQLWGG